jgi:hypothetical protein
MMAAIIGLLAVEQQQRTGKRMLFTNATSTTIKYVC